MNVAVYKFGAVGFVVTTYRGEEWRPAGVQVSTATALEWHLTPYPAMNDSVYGAVEP